MTLKKKLDKVVILGTAQKWELSITFPFLYFFTWLRHVMMSYFPTPNPHHWRLQVSDRMRETNTTRSELKGRKPANKFIYNMLVYFGSGHYEEREKIPTVTEVVVIIIINYNNIINLLNLEGGM